jgi:cyclopropane fatty-acyl-phospholipid synthase-like methyltransferase
VKKTEITIASFNATAAAYAKRFEDCSAYAGALGEFCSLLAPSARLLDIGCGPGNVARWLLDRREDLRIYGIDLSVSMLELFRRNVPEATAEVLDMRQLDELVSRFDGAVASFCLPFLTHEEGQSFISAMSRRVLNGGLLYLSTMQGQGQGFERTSFGGEHEFYFNYYEPEFLDKQLAVNGFEVLDYREQEFPQERGPELVDMIYLARRR